MIEIEHQSATEHPEEPSRSVTASLWRGWRHLCPACAKGRLYWRYLKVVDACPVCGEELHHHRADDAPPYFTIVIVGHVIVGAMLIVETAYHPAVWVHWMIWLPLLLVMSLLLLPRVKGALVGLQWALRMHGFGEPDPVAFDAAPGTDSS